VKLSELAIGNNTAILKGHTDFVWSVAFSPDGRTLASGTWPFRAFPCKLCRVRVERTHGITTTEKMIEAMGGER
jgi:WD40 repeat protein